MQTEESQSKFQFNLQSLAIVMVVMLALGVPLATLLLAFHVASKPAVATKPVETAVIADEGLRSALTQASEKSLPAPPLDEGKSRISLQAKNLDQAQKAIETLAGNFQGVAMVMDSKDGQRTLLVHVSGTSAQDFAKSAGEIEGTKADKKEIHPDSALIEVVLISSP